MLPLFYAVRVRPPFSSCETVGRLMSETIVTDPVPHDVQNARFRVPLWAQVLVGVIVGAALGSTFGTRPYFFGLTNQHLGELGMLVIRLLKALAGPLILFAILDAFVR